MNVIARMLIRADALAQEPGDAAGDDARLAAAGPGQDQQRALEMRDGVLLGGRQVGEQVRLPGSSGHRKLSGRGAATQLYRVASRAAYSPRRIATWTSSASAPTSSNASASARMIERHGELFLTRVFTDREMRYCQRSKHATEHFAGRWAAKEAVLKCLGTGWSKGLVLDRHRSRQRPGRQAARSTCRPRPATTRKAIGIRDVLISISHCRAYATALSLAVRGYNPTGEDIPF